jgi:LmbE family N-acetylglucosaminyl deacetylase
VQDGVFGFSSSLRDLMSFSLLFYWSLNRTYGSAFGQCRSGVAVTLMTIKAVVISSLLFLAINTKAVDRQTAPPRPKADDRYKADILVVIAHPDDESGDIAAYLARAIFDEHRRIAVVCATRGDRGGDEMGDQRAAALGAEREIEGRQALASFGVKNVWFLGAPDTPSQDVLSSLEHWNHGSILGQVVRLVRLTRPEVILTWVPLYVTGENHADHQAASVIATEAFDLAGDPTAFPEQVSPPRDGVDYISTEGLRPWQPQKIYYYSDAYEAHGYWWGSFPEASPFRKSFLDGAGPKYLATDLSPSRHVSYARLAAEETSFYETQEGDIAKEALGKNTLKDFEYPTALIFGKSLVGGSVTGDVFEGVSTSEVSSARTRGFENQEADKPSLEFGGSWKFYSEFWRAHKIEHLAKLLPVPEVAIVVGGRMHIPLLLHNNTASSQDITLTAVLGEGWVNRTAHTVYPIEAGSDYPIQAVLDVPKTASGWLEVTWNAAAGGQQLGSLTLHVLVVKPSEEGGLPQ